MTGHPVDWIDRNMGLSKVYEYRNLWVFKQRAVAGKLDLSDPEEERRILGD